MYLWYIYIYIHINVFRYIAISGQTTRTLSNLSGKWLACREFHWKALVLDQRISIVYRYVYIDPYLYICATCRCICIYSVHSYIDTTYTFTPIPPFVCRYIYPFRSFPQERRHPGRSQCQWSYDRCGGTKEVRKLHWWENAPFSNYAEVLYDQLAFLLFFLDIYIVHTWTKIVYEDIYIYIYIYVVYSYCLYIRSYIHDYAHIHGIFKYVVCLDVFFCKHTYIEILYLRKQQHLCSIPVYTIKNPGS